MTRKSNTEQRRDEITAGLLACIAGQGYERATIESIAREAGLTRGLIHYHFKRKEDILLRLVTTLAATGRKQYAEQAANAQSADERLRAYLDARLSSDTDTIAAWVVIGSQAMRQPEVRSAYQQVVQSEIAFAHELLEACLKERRRETTNCAQLALALNAIIEGAFQLASATPDAMPRTDGAAAALAAVDAMIAVQRPVASLDALRERWLALWSAMDLVPPDGLFEQLVERYREPQRHYHTLQHLEECLARLDEMHALAIHPLEIELALWFHDAIYDVRRQDNEQQSAALAQATLRSAGVPEDAVQRVQALVLDTRHHVQPAGVDAHIMNDADLAILAADPPRFEDYERQIRREYCHVPAAQFTQKRHEVMGKFLNRASIYLTPAFRARHEYAARANLRKLLQASE